MPFCHENEFALFHFECDPFGRMTPGAMLRRVQEIASAHCDTVGIDAAFYQRTGTAFLLSRVSLEMHRMPAAGERVRLQTRAYGMRRAQYHRMNTLYAEDGKVLCEADTRWVLVDIESRRILRRPMEELLPYFNEEPAEEHEMRLQKPGEKLFQFGELRAAYTMCDTNGHVNNTRYADLVCDHLPLDRLRQAPPQKMLFSYHSEIALDTAFALHGAPLGQDGFYFLAQGDDAKYFEASVTF